MHFLFHFTTILAKNCSQYMTNHKSLTTEFFLLFYVEWTRISIKIIKTNIWVFSAFENVELFFFCVDTRKQQSMLFISKTFLVLNFMPFTKMRELRAQCSCLLNTSEQDAKEHKHDLHEQKKINANNTASEILSKKCIALNVAKTISEANWNISWTNKELRYTICEEWEKYKVKSSSFEKLLQSVFF